jgi:hypothetical protein
MMSIRRNNAALGASLLLLVAATSRAQGLDVSIHGFLSQGYMYSTDNNYVSAKTSDGTFEYNEAGLNFTTQPLPNLRIGAQLFARDLGAQGNHKVTVDWAVGDYRFRDWLGIRAGRVKLPTGLYNTLRDVDMGRAEILQPSSAYPISQRDLNAAFDGALLYGTVPLGGAGSLEYEGYVGTQDLEDIYIVERFIRDGAYSSLPGLAAVGLKNPSYAVTRIEADMDKLKGLALVWRTPLPGLRASATYQSSRSVFAADITYSGTMGPAYVSIPTHSETTYEYVNGCIGSLEYQRGGLRLAAEYYRDQVDDSTTISGLPGPPMTVGGNNKGEAWYVQGAYRINETFQGQAYYSVYWPDRADKDGTRYAKQGLEFRAWSKDLAVTGRADITRNWLLKLELHHIDGAAGLSMVENPDGVKQNWNLFVAKTTFYF